MDKITESQRDYLQYRLERAADRLPHELVTDINQLLIQNRLTKRDASILIEDTIEIEAAFTKEEERNIPNLVREITNITKTYYEPTK